MLGPVAYRLRGGSESVRRQFQSEHGPTAPGALFAERSCARSSTSGDVCIRRRSALRWVQGHRRSRLCVCEGAAPVMGAGSTRGRPAGVGTGRPGRKTRGLLHVCGVRKLRFDETAPFCTTDELKQPVLGERTFGSGFPGCNRRSGPRVRLHRWSCYVFERCSASSSSRIVSTIFRGARDSTRFTIRLRCMHASTLLSGLPNADRPCRPTCIRRSGAATAMQILMRPQQLQPPQCAGGSQQ